MFNILIKSTNQPIGKIRLKVKTIRQQLSKIGKKH